MCNNYETLWRLLFLYLLYRWGKKNGYNQAMQELEEDDDENE